MGVFLSIVSRYHVLSRFHLTTQCDPFQFGHTFLFLEPWWLGLFLKIQPVWYMCLNNNFQFFLEIHVGEKVYKNECNIF